jgi:hypothetical protein
MYINQFDDQPFEDENTVHARKVVYIEYTRIQHTVGVMNGQSVLDHRRPSYVGIGFLVVPISMAQWV